MSQVQQQWYSAFPGLPSYQRFVEWMPSTLIALCAYLKHCFGSCTGIGFIDATSLKVCHNRRIWSHQVFKDIASRGKTSVDWFFGLRPPAVPAVARRETGGFKLHLVVNEFGQLLNVTLTPGNVDDRRPVRSLLKGLFGKIFGDRGYVSQKLTAQLKEEFGIEFFAKPRRDMKNKLMRLHDKLLSRKRSIIETINDQLKNISQIEHSQGNVRGGCLRALSAVTSFPSQFLCESFVRINCLLPPTSKA